MKDNLLSSPAFLRAQGILEDVKAPVVPPMEKPPARRVASMPSTVPPITFTPSPSPPSSVKKPSIDPVYYCLVSLKLGRIKMMLTVH